MQNQGVLTEELTKENSSSKKVDAGDFQVNIAMIDRALEESKGYYEMILDKGDESVVLRFNLNAFKNSYLLPDLVKMELIYHAVKVVANQLLNLILKK